MANNRNTTTKVSLIQRLGSMLISIKLVFSHWAYIALAGTIAVIFWIVFNVIYAVYYFICNIYFYICNDRSDIQRTVVLTIAKKNRILLVDDEPDVVYLVKRGLERNGFEVDGYTDPILALQNFRVGVYSLLLLDIKMPKINGIELFNRMDKEDDKVKVCFFSASEYLTSNLKDRFHNSPDKFLFISKPISIPEMIKQIKQFFKGHRQRL